MSLFTNPKRKRQDNEDCEKEARPPTKFLTTTKKPIPATNVSTSLVYACKLCDMKFSTLQALRDHYAAHKNRNQIAAGQVSGDLSKESHTCSICFQKFVSRQDLGGHIRKHLMSQKEKAKPEFLKKKTVSEHDRMHMASISDSIIWENFVKDRPRCDNLTLVTRNFFSREPERVEIEKVQTDIVSLLPLRFEGGESWLELKLGPATNISTDRLHTCKLRYKKFRTLQALGGPHAAHENPNKIISDLKSGTCSICFQKFASGQALGCHLRRKHFISMEGKANSELLKEKILSELDWMYLASKSDSILWENMVKDSTRCDNSTLVTRNIFQRESVRGDVEKVEKKTASLLHLRAEGGDSWLDLKLGPPGGDYDV